MDDEKKIEDMVAMLDCFMGSGGSRMKISVEQGSQALEKAVFKTPDSECQGQNMACQVPTLHQGLDEKEE